MKIANSFAQLDAFTDAVPIDAIVDWLNRTPLTAELLVNYLVFRSDRYVRNRLHDGPAYQALVLCWRNGQRSPIHNHRGSSCGVKVLRGVATETLFEKAPNGLILPVRSHSLQAGQVCASVDNDTHQISNLQAGNADLVSLHIYSPPLLRMEMFSLESGLISEWDDPVNDPFAEGGGI